MTAQLDLLLIDDDVFNLDGLALYLESRGWSTRRAQDAATARQLAQVRLPDVAVIDIVLPTRLGQPAQRAESVGMALARWFKQTWPQVGVVVLSAYADRGLEFLELVQAGYRGLAYCTKGATPDELIRAIESVHQGAALLDKDITTARLSGTAFRALLDDVERPWVERAAGLLDELTPREREVARLLAASRDIENVAAALGLTVKTIANYVTHIYGKLELSALDREPLGLRKTVILSKAVLLADLEKGQPKKQ